MEVFISLFMKYLGYKPMEKLTLLDARTFILDKRRCGISASTCNFYNSSIAFLYKYVLHIPWDQNLVPRMKRDTRLPQLLSMKLCRKLLNCRQYISKLRGKSCAEKMMILYHKDICRCKECGGILHSQTLRGQYMLN